MAARGRGTGGGKNRPPFARVRNGAPELRANFWSRYAGREGNRSGFRILRIAVLLLSLIGLLPAPAEARTEVGWGSRYSTHLVGRRMANGAVLDRSVLAVAHKTLPLGSRVRVVNLENGRTHEGVVMDRGPFTRRLIADVSPALADRLGMNRAGPTRIRLTMATSARR